MPRSPGRARGGQGRPAVHFSAGPRGSVVAAAVVLAAASAAPSTVSAQTLSARTDAAARPDVRGGSGRGAAWVGWTRHREVPYTAPRRQAARDMSPAVYSLLVPGSGQLVQGRRRGWAYLALEAVGWAFYFDRRGAGASLRNRYRDFAWEEARLQTGPRVDGGFEYYETMRDWVRSGAFDIDAAAAGIQPEQDPATFNGSIWVRARSIFLPAGEPVPETHPGWVAAVEYYAERAYGDDFLWDWTDGGTARDDFGALIRDSDDRFRQATNALGAVIANHLISAVDAFVVGRHAAAELRVEPGAPTREQGRWLVTVTVPLSR